MFSRGKGGRRDDLGGRYFRSRWEANYARLLNHKVAAGEIAKWEYEPDTFEFERIKRGTRFYTPDFKVHDLHGGYEYHEIKGWMDSTSALKLRRMAKYHPKEVVRVIGKPQYREISNEWADRIEGWEIDPKKKI